MVKEGDVGIIGGVNAPLSILMVMSAFLAIAFYNVIEVTFLIFAVFKKRNGLYFWSFIVATLGIPPHAIGFILKFFQVTTLDLLSFGIVGVGWVCMVFGQSLVLYSRLHLVVQDKFRIRWVLYMIIFNGVILCIPTIVLAMGTVSNQSARFLRVFVIYDKIQLVLISVQETIISVIYICETLNLLSASDNQRERPLQKLLRHLIFVNLVVLMFEITLIAVQFSGHFEIQTTYKTAVYSIKLKIEFSVLNRLVELVRHKDLLSNRGATGSNNLTFGRWTGDKQSGIIVSTSNHNSFTKVDNVGCQA